MPGTTWTARDKVVPEINELVRTYQEVSDDAYNGPEMSLAPSGNESVVTIDGVKTLKNRKKKKAGLMRKLASKVLKLRKTQILRLQTLLTQLYTANTNMEAGALTLMADIDRSTKVILDTIRDPHQVKMMPHNLA